MYMLSQSYNKGSSIPLLFIISRWF